MENNKQKPFLTLPLRLKLLWLLFSTKRGRAFMRVALSAMGRAKEGNPPASEEWAVVAQPFCELMAERGLDVEYIVKGTKEALKD